MKTSDVSVQEDLLCVFFRKEMFLTYKHYNTMFSDLKRYNLKKILIIKLPVSIILNNLLIGQFIQYINIIEIDL